MDCYKCKIEMEECFQNDDEWFECPQCENCIPFTRVECPDGVIRKVTPMDKSYSTYNKTKSSKETETKIHCFECNQLIPKSDWIENPTDTYGCSRHM